MIWARRKNMRLKNRVALVTAAAGAGIGQAAARALAKEGANVVITDAHEERSVTVAETIGAECGVATLGLKCDVTAKAEVEQAVARTLENFLLLQGGNALHDKAKWGPYSEHYLCCGIHGA
jgi:NAD(P)-dependent dehydrogenase (short-subunit alcohol dehydrogenase family)